MSSCSAPSGYHRIDVLVVPLPGDIMAHPSAATALVGAFHRYVPERAIMARPPNENVLLSAAVHGKHSADASQYVYFRLTCPAHWWTSGYALAVLHAVRL